MSLKGGYWGKILWVNLTTGTISTKTFDEDFARKYLGGVGFATKIIADSVTKETDPLGPDNVLVFATGPWQATTLASVGRCSAGAKSPLTGYWGECNSGGHIGPGFKRAGVDAVVITGRATKPVYLWIKDGDGKLEDATRFWGSETARTINVLKKEFGAGTSVAAIGPAGENLVKYACIMNDNHGAFGRCGLGAVMGSKNLKAVVTKATLTPPVANPELLKAIYKDVRKKIMEAPFTTLNATHGQVASIVPREENGLLPMKNWRLDNWPDGAKLIGSPRSTEELAIKRWPCAYCLMGCHRRITNPQYKSETSGPEYETAAMLGADLLIDDLHAVVEANDLCNRYGLDTIEVGAVLAWAFECYENGLITKEDADGVELTWGNGKALVTMVHKIAKREGIGKLFGEGLRPCVKKIPESKPYAIEAMGMSVAAHDPRAFFGEVITTIASTRGSCHVHPFAEAVELGAVLPELGITEQMDRFEWRKKGYVSAIYQDIHQFWNSLTWCFFYFFSNVPLTDEINILNAVTGWDVTPKEAQEIGERIVCMQQLFNLRMGMVPEKENVMPERLTVPHLSGGAAGKASPWREILKEYWETKDWVKGVPTPKKVAELGLSEF